MVIGPTAAVPPIAETLNPQMKVVLFAAFASAGGAGRVAGDRSRGGRICRRRYRQWVRRIDRIRIGGARPGLRAKADMNGLRASRRSDAFDPSTTSADIFSAGA
jgi:hypothetical protein